MNNQENSVLYNATLVTDSARRRNNLGTIGFMFALIAIYLYWVSMLGWILWIIGAMCSFCGIFEKPRGFAVAGFIMSILGLIIILISSNTPVA